MARRLLASDERINACSARVELQNPRESLLGVAAVQGPQHEVPRLGRLDRRQHRFTITQLADQYAVGILPHDVSQRVSKVHDIDADFPLRDDGLLGLEAKFNRVLDRDDVHAAVSVDEVQHRGQRRTLAAASDTADEHQAVVTLADRLAINRRQVQGVKVGNAVLDPP